jgi:NAD(P)-dependent dehydrogenase (short-subunit alcohol dehydrogenase family)
MNNVIVCGGSGLIGKEICKSMSLYNINIINFDLRKNREVQNNYMLNLGNTLEIKKKLQIVKKKYKTIHAIVNCIYPNRLKTSNFLNSNVNDIVKNITNHTSCFLKINKEISIIFKKQNYGSIINFASIYGSSFPRKEIYFKTEISETGLDYILSKNLLIKFSKYLANEMKKYNVRVNVVSPGGVMNKHSKKFSKNYGKYTSTGKMLLPKDLNDIVYFLISDVSQNITGQEIVVDNGFIL